MPLPLQTTTVSPSGVMAIQGKTWAPAEVIFTRVCGPTASYSGVMLVLLCEFPGRKLRIKTPSESRSLSKAGLVGSNGSGAAPLPSHATL